MSLRGALTAIALSVHTGITSDRNSVIVVCQFLSRITYKLAYHSVAS